LSPCETRPLPLGDGFRAGSDERRIWLLNPSLLLYRAPRLGRPRLSPRSMPVWPRARRRQGVASKRHRTPHARCNGQPWLASRHETVGKSWGRDEETGLSGRTKKQSTSFRFFVRP